MDAIPVFALYGEERTQDETFLHWETITSRSRLYGYHIAPHRHDTFFQILYLASGQAEVTIDDHQRMLDGPALVTVPPLIVHSYRFSPDVKGLVLTLHVRDVHATLAELPEMADAFDAPRVLDDLERWDGDKEIDHAVRRLAREADLHAPGQIAALRARLMLCLLAIWRTDRLGRETSAGGDRAGDLVRRFQGLVDANFRSTRAIGFYSDRLGITPTHLNRVCRVVLASSALGVIERRVVLEAKRYLQFSRLSVKEIAILLGYGDPAYFSRFFARRTGVTPTLFRESKRA